MELVCPIETGYDCSVAVDTLDNDPTRQVPPAVLHFHRSAATKAAAASAACSGTSASHKMLGPPPGFAAPARAQQAMDTSTSATLATEAPDSCNNKDDISSRCFKLLRAFEKANHGQIPAHRPPMHDYAPLAAPTASASGTAARKGPPPGFGSRPAYLQQPCKPNYTSGEQYKASGPAADYSNSTTDVASSNSGMSLPKDTARDSASGFTWGSTSTSVRSSRDGSSHHQSHQQLWISPRPQQGPAAAAAVTPFAAWSSTPFDVGNTADSSRDRGRRKHVSKFASIHLCRQQGLHAAASPAANTLTSSQHRPHSSSHQLPSALDHQISTANRQWLLFIAQHTDVAAVFARDALQSSPGTTGCAISTGIVQLLMQTVRQAEQQTSHRQQPPLSAAATGVLPAVPLGRIPPMAHLAHSQSAAVPLTVPPLAGSAAAVAAPGYGMKAPEEEAAAAAAHTAACLSVAQPKACRPPPGFEGMINLNTKQQLQQPPTGLTVVGPSSKLGPPPGFTSPAALQPQQQQPASGSGAPAATCSSSSGNSLGTRCFWLMKAFAAQAATSYLQGPVPAPSTSAAPNPLAAVNKAVRGPPPGFTSTQGPPTAAGSTGAAPGVVSVTVLADDTANGSVSPAAPVRSTDDAGTPCAGGSGCTGLPAAAHSPEVGNTGTAPGWYLSPGVSTCSNSSSSIRSCESYISHTASAASASGQCFNCTQEARACSSDTAAAAAAGGEGFRCLHASTAAAEPTPPPLPRAPPPPAAAATVEECGCTTGSSSSRKASSNRHRQHSSTSVNVLLRSSRTAATLAKECVAEHEGGSANSSRGSTKGWWGRLHELVSSSLSSRGRVAVPIPVRLSLQQPATAAAAAASSRAPCWPVLVPAAQLKHKQLLSNHRVPVATVLC